MSVKINVTGEDGDSREIEWEDHQTLLEAVQANGFPVLATCGGNASCATCHTFIDPEHYAASGDRTDAEEDPPAPAHDVGGIRTRYGWRLYTIAGGDVI